MNETQKIQLVQDQRKVALDAAIGVVSLGMMYLALHPDKAAKVQTFVDECKAKVTHMLSVWATRNDIRTLPETDERL